MSLTKGASNCVILTSALALLLSCVPRRQGSARVAGRVAVVESSRSVAQVIPHDVSYALVIRRGDWASRAFSDLVRPFGVGKRLSEQLLRDLGFDALDAGALTRAGFAAEREVAVYGHGLLPTFVLPVADDERIAQTLRRIVGSARVSVRDFQGHSVTTWRDSFLRIAHVSVDGWLYVHFAFHRNKDEDTWLRAILDPKGGVGQALQTAAAHSPSRDVLGFVRLPKLGKGVRQFGEALHFGTCPAVDGSVSLFASLDDGGVKSGMFVPLRPAFRTELGRHVGKPPDEAFLAVRDEATASASLSLDLDWLSAQRQSARDDCTLLFWMFEGMKLWDLRDPMSLVPAISGKYMSSYHVAVTSVDEQTGGPRGAGWFGLSGSRGLRMVLALATTVFRKQSRQVNGTSVTRLGLGDMVPMLGNVDYTLGQDAMRVGFGPGMIERMLSRVATHDGPRAPGLDLLAFSARPHQLVQNKALLANLASLLQLPGDALGVALLGLDRLSFAVRLEPEGLRVTSGFHLR